MRGRGDWRISERIRLYGGLIRKEIMFDSLRGLASLSWLLQYACETETGSRPRELQTTASFHCRTTEPHCESSKVTLLIMIAGLRGRNTEDLLASYFCLNLGLCNMTALAIR